MFKKLIIPAIAFAVMFGCSVDDVVSGDNNSKDSGTDVPVDIVFNSSRAMKNINSDYSAIGKVTTKKSIYKNDLTVTDTSITGLIKDVDKDDEKAVVEIIVYDKDGNEAYVGGDVVGFIKDTVHSNLYKVEYSTGLVIPTDVIIDKNNSATYIENDDVKEFINSLIKELDFSEKQFTQIIKTVQSETWSSGDDILVLELAKLIVIALEDGQEAVKWIGKEVKITKEIDTSDSYIDSSNVQKYDTLDSYIDSSNVQKYDTLDSYSDSLDVQKYDTLDSYIDSSNVQKYDTLDSYSDSSNVQKYDTLDSYIDSSNVQKYDTLDSYSDSSNVHKYDTLDSYSDSLDVQKYDTLKL